MDNNIHFDGYQVSNQCMALVADDCLIPTRDAPELGYVKESTNEQYVPDVFYKVPAVKIFNTIRTIFTTNRYPVMHIKYKNAYFHNSFVA